MKWLRTFDFVLVLFPGGDADAQRTPVEVVVVEVAHRALRSLHILVLAEAVAFRLPSLPIIHQPAETKTFSDEEQIIPCVQRCGVHVKNAFQNNLSVLRRASDMFVEMFVLTAQRLPQEFATQERDILFCQTFHQR